MQNIEQLVKIYNILLTISTHGEDTVNMAECLKSLKQTIEIMVQQINMSIQTEENIKE